MTSDFMNCPYCTFLYELFHPIFEQEDSTNREYYIFTEIFVFLHGGKDYCNYFCENKPKEV